MGSFLSHDERDNATIAYLSATVLQISHHVLRLGLNLSLTRVGLRRESKKKIRIYACPIGLLSLMTTGSGRAFSKAADFLIGFFAPSILTGFLRRR
jgi:hypothetical protein